MTRARLNLSPHEIVGSTWANVKQYATANIEHLRGELEKTTKTHEETLIVRGEIRALRYLLESEKAKDQSE